MTTLLYIFVVLLQIADLLTTHAALKLTEVEEKNPIARWLMVRLGVPGGLLLLKGVGIGAAAALWLADADLVLLGLAVLYVYVVWQNWSVINDRQG